MSNDAAQTPLAKDSNPRDSAPQQGFSRRLKFRAFDLAKNEWVEGGYGFHILGEAMLLGGLFQDYGLAELNNINITQFTGIQDRNGEDVYEGDVVRHEYGGVHVVHWLAETSGFFVGKQNWPLSKLCTPRIEVVGNVFGKAQRGSARNGDSNR